MDSIRDIIPQVIENLSGKRPNSARNIHEVWKIVVKEGAQHSTVTDFKKGVLRINVDSSAWLYQLNMHKAAFLKGLKSELPEITDIVYKVGKIN
jgi:predicted nucleic acid-binding Zn ribbon protein